MVPKLGVMKILIDYQQLTPGTAERALVQVTKQLASAGLTVVSVGADGKPKRVGEVSYREVLLTFADSQTLALRIKNTGDVFQVLINGKLTPIAEQDDARAAIREIALLIDRARAAFLKRLAAIQMRPPEGAKTAAPRMEATLKAQIAEVDAQIAQAKEELAALLEQ